MRIQLENFTKRFDGAAVIEDLNLTIEEGEMLALLGPSGCGKSTTLFAICGIHRLDEGRILFGDRDVSGLPSQQRNVGVVFQSYALYPHMSVFENIAFPLTVQKKPAGEVDRAVRQIAELVHIEELLERRPSQLSGGQQQRVALARALVRKPDVLLLDEPLANLDAKLRLEMRAEVRRIQLETGITAVLVTHDQVEAMSMCDRIAIMNKGKILQISEPTEMYRNPVDKFVAGFLGNPPIVFVEGYAQGRELAIPETQQSIPLPKRFGPPADGEKLTIGVRPEHFGNGGSAKLSGKVTFVEPQGRETLYDVRIGPRTVLRSIQPTQPGMKVGDMVSWALDVENLLVFDSDGCAASLSPVQDVGFAAAHS